MLIYSKYHQSMISVFGALGVSFKQYPNYEVVCWPYHVCSGMEGWGVGWGGGKEVHINKT